MAFFAKLLFNKLDELTFPAAANYVKMISFAAALDAARKKKIPISISELIEWSNDWLGPDFVVREKKKSVILYDQKHNRQWLDRPVQNFYTTLLKQSYLSMILRKMKRAEVAKIESMAKAYSREIEHFVNEHQGANGFDDGGQRLDSASILWNLWLGTES